jgi:hypothetical protein
MSNPYYTPTKDGRWKRTTSNGGPTVVADRRVTMEDMKNIKVSVERPREDMKFPVYGKQKEGGLKKEEWYTWKKDIRNWVSTRDLTQKKSLEFLKLHLLGEPLAEYSKFKDEDVTFEEALLKIQEGIFGPRSRMVLKNELRKIKWKDGESIQEYIRKKEELMKEIDPEYHNEDLAEELVEGILDNTIFSNARRELIRLTKERPNSMLQDIKHWLVEENVMIEERKEKILIAALAEGKGMPPRPEKDEDVNYFTDDDRSYGTRRDDDRRDTRDGARRGDQRDGARRDDQRDGARRDDRRDGARRDDYRRGGARRDGARRDRDRDRDDRRSDERRAPYTTDTYLGSDTYGKRKAFRLDDRDNQKKAKYAPNFNKICNNCRGIGHLFFDCPSGDQRRRSYH